MPSTIIKCSICSLLFYTIIFQCSGQDTLLKKGRVLLDVEFWGSQIFEKGYFPAVSMPENIRLRRTNSLTAVSNFNYATDNPLRHGAYYAVLKNKIYITQGVRINFDLYGEHRGVSYGVFNTKNVIVYPIIFAEGIDSFFLGNKKFIIEGKVGQFLNEKLDQGLLIYNIDAQGLQTNIRISEWKVSYTLYGDFYNGIGLNIDDLHALSIVRYFGNERNTQIGFSINTTNPAYEKKIDNLRLNLFGNYYLKNGVVYSQLGYRTVDKSQPKFEKRLSKQIGFVIGVKLKDEKRKFVLTNRIEFRYYGKSFNARHFVNGLLYRQPLTVRPLYANTIGEYLYSLRKFETPFSQWTVFTEYQGSNVAGLSLTGLVGYKFSKKIEGELEYDFNEIIAGKDTAFAFLLSGSNNFFYPFFSFGIYYKPIKNFKAGFIITNKGMNLDISYPTFYLYKRPYFGIKMYRTIK